MSLLVFFLVRSIGGLFRLLRPFVQRYVNEGSVQGIRQNCLGSIPLCVFPPSIVSNTRGRVRVSRDGRSDRRSSYRRSLFQEGPNARAPGLFYGNFLSSCGRLFRAFGVLAIVRFSVPILRRARNFGSRAIQVVITTNKIRRPTAYSGTTFNRALLPSGKRFHVNRSLVQVNVRVTPSAIGPGPLTRISQGSPIMVSLLYRVRVVNVNEAIARRRNPLSVALGHALIEKWHGRRFVRPPSVLPYLRQAILLRIL